jgi:hypothetical protein
MWSKIVLTSIKRSNKYQQYKNRTNIEIKNP